MLGKSTHLPLFGLTARLFTEMCDRSPPECRYCRRWPTVRSGDSCLLCRCCFQIAQFAKDTSLGQEQYKQLTSELTRILGELTTYSSYPSTIGQREEERQSRRDPDHQRSPSSSRESPVRRSGRTHHPRAREIEESLPKESRRPASPEAPPNRSSRSSWVPSLQLQQRPEETPVRPPVILKSPPPPPKPARESQLPPNPARAPPAPPPPPKREPVREPKGTGKGKEGKGSEGGKRPQTKVSESDFPRKKKKKNRGQTRVQYWADRLAKRGNRKKEEPQEIRGEGAALGSPSEEESLEVVAPAAAVSEAEPPAPEGGKDPRVNNWADASEARES